MENTPVLQMKNICKSFGGVYALRNFSVECQAGEVHILMGENGAGKSTLFKILGGVHFADSGQICIDGKSVEIRNPIDARNNGIAFIYQELNMCEPMTVAENIFRGFEPTKKPFGFVDDEKMNREAQAILNELHMGIRATDLVKNLSIAQQQMVEIAGALSKNARIIIMDEPTASLTDREINALFEMIEKIRKQGTCILYVSHRMDETFRIGDRVTVMRDGQFIGTKQTGETTSEELIAMMVGRPLTDLYNFQRPIGTETVLEVRGLTNERLHDVSFTLKKGEILGLAGLVGAGRTETAQAIFGLDPLDSGEILIEGSPVRLKSPAAAIKAGIAFVPEDRKRTGLMLKKSVGENLTITVLDQFIHGIHIDTKKEQEIINTYFHALSIKSSGPAQICGDLSGGNQQKIVLSKWLAIKPSYLILDEPTRGIDVGTKAEIYSLINRLAHEGVSIILISSELPEIIHLCSRVVVLYEGRVTGVLDAAAEDLTQVKIMKYAMGGI